MRFRQNLPFLGMLLTGLGVTNPDGTRLDANETGFLAKSLEYVQAQAYDVEYAPADARRFIPVDTSVPNGAETFAYDQWDTTGLAKIIANYADDLPGVAAFVTRIPAVCKSVGASYDYSLQDIRAIQFARSRLDEKRIQAASQAIEYTIDNIAAFGNAEHGLTGFLNSAAVPVVNLPNGNWTISTSADAMLADLTAFANAIVSNTKTRHKPNTILLDTESYGFMLRPVGADYGRTIMSAFLSNNPYITSIDQWVSLDNADANGTGPRWVCYEKSPLVVNLVISQEFEQLPPQAKNLAFHVPCHARTGGVTFRIPLACAYADRDL